ncbi:MAG: hypothetical protein QM723_16055 [Myxococcaceae bacterium]
MTLRVGISWLAPMLFGLGATLLAMVVELGSPAWIKPKPRLALPQDPVPSLDPERLSALTGLAARRERASTPVATEPTRLHLRARGTLLGPFIDWAAIQDLDTGKMQSYAVGDVVQGATILAINRSLITLRENGHATYLEVSGLGRVVATPPPPPREVTPGHFSIARQEVERQLGNLAELAPTVRAMPTPHGMKLFAIRPGSLPAQLGVQNGDTITKVNGIALDHADGLLEAYTRLRSSSHFEIQIERDGAPVTQTYDLQ